MLSASFALVSKNGIFNCFANYNICQKIVPIIQLFWPYRLRLYLGGFASLFTFLLVTKNTKSKPEIQRWCMCAGR